MNMPSDLIKLILAALCLNQAVLGQWNCAGSICSTGTNVGIGTTAPQYKLHIAQPGTQGTPLAYLYLQQTAGADSVPVRIGVGGWNGGVQTAIDFIQNSGSNWQSQIAFSTYTGASLVEAMRINSSGNVGIGTTNPTTRLHVVGLGDTASAAWNIRTMARFSDGGMNSNSAIVFDTGASGTTAFRGLEIGKNSQDLYFARFDSGGASNPTVDVAISSTGKVGIGTLSPQYPLSVNGTIQAKEVIVNTGWADYVFKSDYKLKSLDEIASYVAENHHLPDIPDESEVREKGISIGEIQTRMMAKIEELTLHLIEEQKQNRELRERIARIEMKVGEPAAK